MKSKITDLYVNQHCNPAFIIHQVKGEQFSNEIRNFLENLVIKTHIEEGAQDSNDDDYQKEEDAKNQTGIAKYRKIIKATPSAVFYVGGVLCLILIILFIDAIGKASKVAHFSAQSKSMSKGITQLRN